MFELTIMQKRPSNRADNYIFEETEMFYFTADELPMMFEVIEVLLNAARTETEYTIRVIEEGQICD